MSEPDPVLASLDRLHARLDHLEARLDRFEPVVALLDRAPDAIAMFTDSFDDLADHVAARGAPLHERAAVLLTLAERLSSPASLAVLAAVTEHQEAVRGLLDSGVLEPETVHVVGLAGEALVQTQAAAPEPLGPLAALRAFHEPPLRRALGFAVGFARRFGAALDASLPTRR